MHSFGALFIPKAFSTFSTYENSTYPPKPDFQNNPNLCFLSSIVISKYCDVYLYYNTYLLFQMIQTFFGSMLIHSQHKVNL